MIPGQGTTPHRPQPRPSAARQIILKKSRDCPGGSVGKNLPANAGDTGLIPGPGRSHTPRGN